MMRGWKIDVLVVVVAVGCVAVTVYTTWRMRRAPHALECPSGVVHVAWRSTADRTVVAWCEPPGGREARTSPAVWVRPEPSGLREQGRVVVSGPVEPMFYLDDVDPVPQR
jgi:hypothetical protein